MMQDVIVIGGGYAGMAAALQLVRARKRVLVVDAGERRNRFAASSHGFLGQDGADPAQIAATARQQLAAYPTLTWIDDRVETVAGAIDDFTVTLAEGSSHKGRRLLLATGVADQLPQIDGLAERWGKAVFHCPYCHGFELDQGRIGVIASGPMSLHQAQLITEWGEVTFLTNGTVEPNPAELADLAAHGVTVEPTPIAGLQGHADIALQDGRVLPFAGLFVATRTAPASDVAEKLGCALAENPLGLQIATDETKATSVPGVFACGDVGRAPHSVSLAVGDGAWAGAQLHRSLIWPQG